MKHAPTHSTQYLIKRLLRNHIRPELRRILLSFFFMTLVALATGAQAKLMEPILDQVFAGRDPIKLYEVSAMVLVTFLIKAFAAYGQSVTISYTGQNILSKLQVKLFNHLIHADVAFFQHTSTGFLISRLINDVNTLRNAVTNSVTGIGRDALTIVCLVGVMFYQDWLLAILSFTAFPTALYPIIRLGRRMRKVSTNTQEEMGQFTTLLNQVFQGARHVKAYSMEQYESSRAEKLINKIFSLIYKAARIRSASRPMMEVVGGIAIISVILYGGHQVIDGTRTTGAFFSFITALLLAYEPIKRLAALNTDLQEGLAAAGRIFDTLDIKPKITDRKNAKPLNIKKGEIVFDNVHFSYELEKTALNGIDLKIPAGKTVALVGHSGGGKSTIMNLIARFYDLNEGTISIDGKDISSITLASLRRQIALVSQEITLFDDSVRANIAYGQLDASEEEIIAAARNAAAHDFIMQLPQGYDTLVGERGLKLSGGQRQRLSIARAMLKNAPLLLLDEATSALDTESEHQVQAALKKLMQGRTTLVIAHRLSTVKDANLIYVVENGKVTESGSHTRLMQKKGRYAQLYALQFHDKKNP